MKDFSLKISLPHAGNAEMYFSAMLTGKGLCYHVSARSGEEGLHYFTMCQKEKGWQIINAPKVPDWILLAETDLQTAIANNL